MQASVSSWEPCGPCMHTCHKHHCTVIQAMCTAMGRYIKRNDFPAADIYTIAQPPKTISYTILNDIATSSTLPVSEVIFSFPMKGWWRGAPPLSVPLQRPPRALLHGRRTCT
jgi:hypothetical protein